MTKEIGKHRAERDLPERLEAVLQPLRTSLACAVLLCKLIVDIIKAIHGAG